MPTHGIFGHSSIRSCNAILQVIAALGSRYYSQPGPDRIVSRLERTHFLAATDRAPNARVGRALPGQDGLN